MEPIEFFIKFNSLNAQRGLVSKPINTYYAPAAVGVGTTTLTTYISYNGTSWANASPTPSWSGLTLDTTNWHHIAIVRNGVNFNGYYDGVLAYSYTVGTNSLASTSGGWVFGNSTVFAVNSAADAFIDETLISNYARYTSNFTPPARAFDRNGLGYPAIKLQSNGLQTSKVWTDADALDSFKVDVASTTRLTINASGNIGLGTVTPMNRLDVYGGQVIGTTYAGVSSAPANGLLVVGNVGIGTVAPRAKLEVDGNIYNLKPDCGQICRSNGFIGCKDSGTCVAD